MSLQEQEALNFTPRQRVWIEIRKAQSGFSLVDIAFKAHMKEGSARSYFSGLEKAGYICLDFEEDIPGKRVKRKYYKLVKDCGFTAPSLDSDGNETHPARINKAMWNTLRILKRPVNADELAKLSSNDKVQVQASTANVYLQLLYSAGYLALAQMAQNKIGKKAKYQLFDHKNTGPNPPQIQRSKQVFDPNLGTVVFREQPELEEELKHGTLLHGVEI